MNTTTVRKSSPPKRVDENQSSKLVLQETTTVINQENRQTYPLSSKVRIIPLEKLVNVYVYNFIKNNFCPLLLATHLLYFYTKFQVIECT